MTNILINPEHSGEIEKIFKAKEQFHIKQAKLPIEEKVRILVELQKIACNINPKLDKNKIWKI